MKEALVVGCRSRAQLVLLVLALAPTGAVLGCGRARIMTGQTTAGGEVVTFTAPAQTVVAPGSADPTAFRAALGRTLEREHWTVVSDDGQRIVARREHRQLVLQIAIVPQGTDGLEIAYVDSTNMPIETPTTSRRYDAWLRDLQHALVDEVDPPRRDAEEAARHAEELARQERERQERQAREAQEVAARCASRARSGAADGQSPRSTLGWSRRTN